MVVLEDGRHEFWHRYATSATAAAFEVELQHRASHDPLTDLPNRSVFTTAMVHARRAPITAGLARGDRPGRLQAVNDTHGHPAGITSDRNGGTDAGIGVRDTDVIARIGGDEFLVLCPNTSARDADTLVRRLRQEYRSRSRLGAGVAVTVGCSVGWRRRRTSPSSRGCYTMRTPRCTARSDPTGMTAVRHRQLTPITASSSAR
jgi:diguanylate cyclase (GGDEF)-like protein